MPARDLTLEAAQNAGPRKSTRPLPAQQIKKLLDSRNEREVLDGLRRVIAVGFDAPLCDRWGPHVDMYVDAICLSSAVDLDFLPVCSEDAIESVSVHQTAGLYVLVAPCRAGPGYCAAVDQHDSEELVRLKSSSTRHGIEDHERHQSASD